MSIKIEVTAQERKPHGPQFTVTMHGPGGSMVIANDHDVLRVFVRAEEMARVLGVEVTDSVDPALRAHMERWERNLPSAMASVRKATRKLK